VKFNGVLCGRATWKKYSGLRQARCAGIPAVARNGRRQNIQNVNERLKAATPWTGMYS